MLSCEGVIVHVNWSETSYIESILPSDAHTTVQAIGPMLPIRQRIAQLVLEPYRVPSRSLETGQLATAKQKGEYIIAPNCVDVDNTAPFRPSVHGV